MKLPGVSGSRSLLVLLLGILLALSILNPATTKSDWEISFGFDPFSSDSYAAAKSCREALKDVFLELVGLQNAPEWLQDVYMEAFSDAVNGACNYTRIHEIDLKVHPTGGGGYVTTTYTFRDKMTLKFWSPWKDFDYCFDPGNLNNFDYEKRCYTIADPTLVETISQDINENTTLYTITGEFKLTYSVGVENFASLTLLEVGLTTDASDVKLTPNPDRYWAFDRWIGECVGNTDEDGTCDLSNIYYNTETTAYFYRTGNVTIEMVDQDGNQINPGCSILVNVADPITGATVDYYPTQTTKLINLREGSYVTVHMRSPSLECSNGYRFDHIEYGDQVWGWDPNQPSYVTITSEPAKEVTVKVVFWKRTKVHVHVVNEAGYYQSALKYYYVYLGFHPPDDAVSHSKLPYNMSYSNGETVSADAYSSAKAKVTISSSSLYNFDHFEGACQTGEETCYFNVSNSNDVDITAVYWRLSTNTYVRAYSGSGDSVPSACWRAYLEFVPPDGAYHPIVPSNGSYSYWNPAGEAYYRTKVIVTPADCSSYGFAFDHYWWNWQTSDENTFYVSRWENYLRLYYWKLVDLGVGVVDDLDHSLGCSVNLNFTAPGGSFHAPEPDGNYMTTTIEDLYKGTDVKASPLSCPGYAFDHWETSDMGGDPSTGATLGDDPSLTGVYWKLVDLGVQVVDDLNQQLDCSVNLNFTAPEGSLNAPEPDGNYTTTTIEDLYRHTGLEATPLSCPGYHFDHWETSGMTGDPATNATLNEDPAITGVYWKLYPLQIVVTDELGNPINCPVDLDLTPPSGAQDPLGSDGIYGTGSEMQLYRNTNVNFSSVACPTFRFDHWEVNGQRIDQDSGTLIMNGSFTLKAVYWKQYSLKIEVTPDGSGNAHIPWSRGTYMLDRGRKVTLSPIANAGWTFDYWEFDRANEGNSNRLEFEMNGNHTVIIHFKKVEASSGATTETIPMESSGEQQSTKVCSLDSESVREMKYRGMYIDLMFNEDLLREFAGRAGPEEDENYVMLGGPHVIPYPWERYDVTFGKDTLTVAGHTYRAKFGSEDYGSILVDCDRNIIRVAGVNRFGTRAALMWLLDHPDKVSGHFLVVVHWKDLNHDGRVQDWEISLLYTTP